VVPNLIILYNARETDLELWRRIAVAFRVNQAERLQPTIHHALNFRRQSKRPCLWVGRSER
jgi:hypothetical protein